jgi:hypothetical protein
VRPDIGFIQAGERNVRAEVLRSEESKKGGWIGTGFTASVFRGGGFGRVNDHSMPGPFFRSRTVKTQNLVSQCSNSKK